LSQVAAEEKIMSELEQYYEAVCTGYWADEDPAHCGCKGRGWMLSELDTWHQCPVHGAGARHPEDAFDDDTVVTSNDFLREAASADLDEVHSFTVTPGTDEEEEDDIPF
jgi:hypothetical protein